MSRKHNLAIQYAERALSVNKKNAVAYATLAETYGLLGHDEAFYRNVELALTHGLPIWEQMDEAPYELYSRQKRFQELIEKYKR